MDYGRRAHRHHGSFRSDLYWAPCGSAASANPLWSRIFVRGQKTNIVVSDTSLVMMQMILRTDITLREYLGHDYPSNLIAQEQTDRGREILSKAATQQYTDFGDLRDCQRLFGHWQAVRRKARDPLCAQRQYPGFQER